ncbi:hypothetical protein [Sphingorhabdus sp.]|jgi:hypothetical protein|uniref:hypothetical protein n=1 Tax=Sphingorhabdus sp. TaxID=1902408 RepID=UPI0037C4FC01
MIRNLLLAVCLTAGLSACSTTQKTEGSGLLSVVTQNVLTIAGEAAVSQVDFSSIKSKGIQIEMTGFVEEKNKGFLTNLVASKAENAGALLVRLGKPDLILEVVVNRAGNDAGKSSVPILKASRRTEATVDLTLTFRDPMTGQRISSQRVAALSKYEQAKWVGIVDGKGQYFVRSASSEQQIGGVASRVTEELNNKSWTKVIAP